MAGFLLTILGMTVMAILVRGLAQPEGHLKGPFLFAAVYAIWVIPEIWSVLGSAEIPDGALSLFMLMSLFCLLAFILGWSNGLKRGMRPDVARPKPMDEGQFKTMTVGMTAFAVAMTLALGLGDHEVAANGNWTGSSTILYFFSNLKAVALCLSFLYFLRFRNATSIALLAVNCLLYMPVVLIYFRRRGMMEFALTLGLTFWFERRKVIPRAVVITALFLSTFVVFGIGMLRALTPDGSLPSLHELMSADLVSVSPFQTSKTSPEVSNAANLIYYSAAGLDFSYGGDTWNNFVFQFVPGQFIGFETKQSLMYSPSAAEFLQSLGYDARNGTTLTGAADAFREFGPFGVVFFLLIGRILGNYWAQASAGSKKYQIRYVLALVPALLSITAYASYFFVNYFLYFLALLALERIVGFESTRAPAPRMAVQRAVRR